MQQNPMKPLQTVYETRHNSSPITVIDIDNCHVRGTGVEHSKQSR
ncbi:uncharacterized protein METZ01_LOCUS448298, partial [marine metagenome]